MPKPRDGSCTVPEEVLAFLAGWLGCAHITFMVRALSGSPKSIHINHGETGPNTLYLPYWSKRERTGHFGPGRVFETTLRLNGDMTRTRTVAGVQRTARRRDCTTRGRDPVSFDGTGPVTVNWPALGAKSGFGWPRRVYVGFQV